jgi:hypothetical protein
MGAGNDPKFFEAHNLDKPGEVADGQLVRTPGFGIRNIGKPL